MGDVLLRDSCLHELPAIRLGQIDPRSLAQVFALRQPALELLCYLRPDQVALPADARPDRRKDVFRTAGETLLHCLHRSEDDPARRAPPSRVHGRHRAEAFIRKQDGQAVGGADSEELARPVRDERISFSQTAPAPVRVEAAVRVDLAHGDQVFGNPRAGKAGAEAVYEPRQSLEASGAVDVAFVFVKQSGLQTGFWTCAIMTCFLKFSNIDSSSRTSVGRLASVAI